MKTGKHKSLPGQLMFNWDNLSSWMDWKTANGVRDLNAMSMGRSFERFAMTMAAAEAALRSMVSATRIFSHRIT